MVMIHTSFLSTDTEVICNPRCDELVEIQEFQIDTQGR